MAARVAALAQPPEEARRVLGALVLLCEASLAAEACAEWFDPEWWRRRGGLETRAGGRGPVHFLRHGEGDWVLRQYRRGGFARHFSTDRYLWSGESSTRSFAEWRLLARLYRRGLPVPRPIAACYRRHGPLLYSAALITARLPAPLTLAGLIEAGRAGEAPWRDIGAAIARLHAAGVSHADLNAGNVLLDETLAVYFVDFDQGRAPSGTRRQRGNLARLHRSLQKIAEGCGREADPAHWQQLLAGYAEARERLSSP